MTRVHLLTHFHSNKGADILESGISWTQDSEHLCLNHTVYYIASFCPFTRYIYEYQYYFPVGGKWYWMVAKLLEGRLLSWLKEPFSILSLNQCAFVHVCVFVCLNAILLVCMCECVFHFDEEQNELVLTAPRGHMWKSSRDAGKYSRSSAGWKDCNQTINQKSLNCHPPTPSPSPLLSLFLFFLLLPFSSRLQSSLYRMICCIHACLCCSLRDDK